MVGFVLKNPLSDNGGVTREVCQEDNHKLIDIVENHNIECIDEKTMTNGKKISLDKEDMKSEYLLPTIIRNLLKAHKASAEVLESYD